MRKTLLKIIDKGINDELSNVRKVTQKFNSEQEAYGFILQSVEESTEFINEAFQKQADMWGAIRAGANTTKAEAEALKEATTNAICKMMHLVALCEVFIDER